jgi:phosphoglycerate dehydrogenase-like enzyme
VGDSYLPVSAMRPELDGLGEGVRVRFRTVDPDARPPLEGITEHQGDPASLVGWLRGETVLVVHAAPVTRQVLEAHPEVRLVVCLRGGAVNIDLPAARDLGVRVVNTPGKNAEAVADLTLLLLQTMLRGVVPATRWLADQARSGVRHLDSTFVGGQWVAREPRGLTLGLVGLGAVGRRVAVQARSSGMTVLAHDPFATGVRDLAEPVTLEELTRRSDVVSIHATASAATHHLVDRTFLSSMRRGALLVNTARQSLVDEAALLDSLRSGHLAGAALDVCEPDGHWPELSRMPQVIVTPHLGGATVQTQQRGMSMAVADIRRFLAGEPLAHRLV